jgi:cytochrome c oxidase subunit II
MFAQIIFFPRQASTVSHQVDTLLVALTTVTGAVGLLVAGLLIFFAIRYRRRPGAATPGPMPGNLRLELFWSLTPLAIFLGFFVWGAMVYFEAYRAPDDATVIYAVGKQWMWKFQHPEGQREINELHVPVGRAVKLIATSEDVIHDVFMPEFRVKADVIPGRYVNIWFQATKPGRYHLFCAEYCGTRHSGMIGQIVVMEPSEYQAWLSGGGPEGSLASAGEKLFADLACNTCHRPDAQGRGPVLQGLFGKTVTLQSGETAVVDEAYVRESILLPSAKIAAGYQPIMPTFQGLVTEEQLLELIEYVKSLKGQPEVLTARPEPSAPSPGENTPVKKK